MAVVGAFQGFVGVGLVVDTAAVLVVAEQYMRLGVAVLAARTPSEVVGVVAGTWAAAGAFAAGWDPGRLAVGQ